MNLNELEIVELGPPLSLALGRFGIALRVEGFEESGVIFAAFDDVEEAGRVKDRLTWAEEGGLVDPLTGNRYLVPLEPERDQGRPSLAEVAEAIRQQEARIGERCAAYTGLNPSPEGIEPWPACVDWSKGYEGDSHPEPPALTEVFPERYLTGELAEVAAQLGPGERLAANDLWGHDCVRVTWDPGPLDAGPWNTKRAEWERYVVGAAHKAMAQALVAYRKGEPLPSVDDLAARHLRVVNNGADLLVASHEVADVTEATREEVRSLAAESRDALCALLGQEEAERLVNLMRPTWGIK